METTNSVKLTCLSYIRHFGEYRPADCIEEPPISDVNDPDYEEVIALGLFWLLNLSRLSQTILVKTSPPRKADIPACVEFMEKLQTIGALQPLVNFILSESEKRRAEDVKQNELRPAWLQ